MALWGRIVDGVLGDVGPLPVRARRLDTGEEVNPAEWLQATGYYDLETLTLDDFPDLTVEQRDVLAVAVVAALQRHTARDELADRVEAITGLIRSLNWDWIDAYCHGDVATIPFVQEQSPNAGTNWGTPTAAVAADRLRLGVSMALAELIRVSQGLDLVFTALAAPISDADVAPPPDR